MPTVTTSTDRQGAEVMRQAARLLSDRLPHLADRLAAEIVTGETWARPTGMRDDLWKLCHVGLSHGVEAILSPSRGRTDLDWAARLGRRRAEQGQPLDQLLRSYRLAGRVFWESVVEVVAQDDPSYVPILVRQATRTWQTIEEQSTAVVEAYHRTGYDLMRRSDERRHAILDALLEGRGADGDLLTTATEVLGLPARGRYAVVILGQQDEVPRPATAAAPRFLWRLRADTQVALVDLGSLELDEVVEALRPHVRAHAGVSPVVESLAELGTARWLAEVALRTCWTDGVDIAVLDRRLPDALLISQPKLGARLGRVRLGPLLQVEAGYRDVLLTTLATWLDCDGSAARAAALLYCHHNTVLNRLRRIESLTGCVLARPRDLVELVLALSAIRLLEGVAP
ncbi:PucR family transcriptional regulator [Actinomadura flavalba]|uniref:PucR family transcriptional regulator n=1 Tax=Actinomadura flavalba TaxID=1120938 RepID=UPI00036BE8FE|nr:helix-turn-helix domain-containing protein [Actinomadura flavalba]